MRRNKANIGTETSSKKDKVAFFALTENRARDDFADRLIRLFFTYKDGDSVSRNSVTFNSARKTNAPQAQK